MEAKLGVVQKLSDLYLQTNHFDRLVERFERGRREANQEREQTICLAQAYQAAGDYGTARQELERLLTQNTRDTQLLQQLSSLAESEGDIAAVIKYQRQRNLLAPSKEGEMRLAQFLLRTGGNEEAATIWTKMAESGSNPADVLGAIDSLLAHDKLDVALLIIERLLREQPRNWELLYRAGSAIGKGRPDEAQRHFRAILALEIPDDEQGVQAKSRSQTRAPLRQPTGRRRSRRLATGFRDPTRNVWQISQVINIDERDQYRYGRGNYRVSYGSYGQNWSPEDFGDARLAALGWLYLLADARGEKDQFLDSIRPAADKADVDSRALWDWYALQLLRQDQKESHAASRRLSQSGDTVGQWLYLESLASRPAAGNVSNDSNDDEAPPLPPDELEHVVSCYRSIAEQHLDWLLAGSGSGAAVVKNVMTELKRAGRTDEEEKIYQDFVDRAKMRGALSLALQLAATRGDFETCVALFDAQARRTAGEKSDPSGTWIEYEIVQSVTQLMSKRGEAGAHADVLVLFDKSLSALARRPAPVNSARPSQRGSDNEPYAMIWRGDNLQNESFDYPRPNRYFDQEGLNVLRQVYDVYEQSDLLSDLIGHCRRQATTAAEKERLLWQLALADVLWWSGETEPAIAELTKGAQQVSDDPSLRLDLAELLAQIDRHAAALTICDSIVPANHEQLLLRERLALRLAVRTGQVARARRAAERLFGLRLDSELQIELAAGMRQLGMHDLAEGILGRARRQAGNRSSILISLMHRYEADQNFDLMQEVAFHILRLSNPVSQSGGRAETDRWRQQALAVLARSGRIKDMIERVEAQIKVSPESVRLYQTLAEYHQAAGDKALHLQTLRRMAELRTDDMALVMQVAREIENTGKAADALELYRTVIIKDPALFSRNQQQICRAFQQAHKVDVLAALLDEIDLARVDPRQPLELAMHVLFRDEKQHAAGLKLFRRIWQAQPERRARLLVTFEGEELAQMPEVYDFARDAAIPRSAAALADPWSGFERLRRHRGEQQNAMTRLVELALKQNRLPELRDEVQQAVTRLPSWSGGKALLIVIHARMQRPELALPLVEELLSDRQQRIPAALCSLLGAQLENHDVSRQVAYRLFEDSFDRSDFDGLDWEILQRLTSTYRKQGDATKVRDLILKLSSAKPRGSRNRVDAMQTRIQTSFLTGYALAQSGFPLDAVRAFREFFNDEVLMQLARKDNAEYQFQQYTQFFRKALHGLRKQDPRQAIEVLLETPPPDPARTTPIFNLLIEVSGSNLERREVLASLIYQALKSAAGTPELKALVRDRTREIAEQHPDDLSAHVLACLAAALDENHESLRDAAKRLAALAERTPLEQLPAGARANSRQRVLAARQAGLWFAARECLKHADLRETGETLAARALEAARRQTDREMLTAMLREWGQSLYDHGDLDGARARWSEMLDAVLRKDKAGKGSAPRAQASDPEEDATAAVSPVTLAQFVEAAEIATLAGKRGLAPLSLRAMHDALVAGPPVQDAEQDRWLGMRAGGGRGRIGRDQSDNAEVFQQVEQALAPLSMLWSHARVPAADQFDVLAAAVLPTGRPAEIFLYAHFAGTGEDSHRFWQRRLSRRDDRYLSPESNHQPGWQSLGRRLAAVAVQSGRTAELRQRIADRHEQPLAKLPALVLLSQLALEAGDDAHTRVALHDLHVHLEGDNLVNSAELGCHAALPALERPELAAEALAVLELALKRLTAAPEGSEQCSELIWRLARRHLARGELEAARTKFRQLVEYHEKVRQHSRHGMFHVSSMGSEWSKIADEYLRAGCLRDALDALHQEFQSAESATESATETVRASAETLSALARLALELPPAERYELLKSWTIPAANPRQVRLLAGFQRAEELPDVFRTLSDSLASAKAEGGGRWVSAAPVAGLPHGDYINTADLLIGAARQAGRIDDLLAALNERASEGVKNAAELELAARISSSDAAVVLPEVRKFVAEIAKRFAEKSTDAAGKDENDDAVDDDLSAADEQVRSASWAEYLVVRECLLRPELRDLGEKTLKLWIDGDTQDRAGVPGETLQQNLTAITIARGLPKNELPSIAPDLQWWSGWAGSASRSGKPADAPLWAVQEGHIVGLSGGLGQNLYFKYPLTGPFEFSVDVLTSPESSGGVGFGGMQLNVQAEEFSAASGYSIDAFGSAYRARRRRRVSPDGLESQFRRLTLRSDSRRVQVFVDNQLTQEEDLAVATSPFLMLFSWQHSVYRNLSLRGDVHIPPEVPLAVGDLFDGWSADRYGESRKERPPKPRIPDDDDDFENAADDDSVDAPNADEAEYDWWAKDGVIHARPPDLASTGSAAQSLLVYERPFDSGDSLRYEFYYEPEKLEVHPALGRLAFLLDPAGVRLHWMVDPTNQSDWNVLPVDNAVDEPSCRRGPQPLPLKPGDWNQMRLSVVGNVCVIELNGVEIYRHPLEITNDSRFGLFRDPSRHGVQVRSVVLSGDWPKQISPDQLGNLLASTAGSSSAVARQARTSLIGDHLLAMNWELIRQRAAALHPAGRYELLRDWVVPGEGHTAFRLMGGFAPLLPQPSGTATLNPTSPGSARRMTGGDIVAPALDLMDTAQDLQKLDELERVARDAPVATDFERRSRLAFLALVAARRRDVKAATDHLVQLARLSETIPRKAQEAERWPELLAASAALGTEDLARPAVAVLDRLIPPTDTRRELYSWDRNLIVFRNRLESLALPRQERAPLRQWAPVSQATARILSRGAPPPQWVARRGEVSHVAGFDHDLLYFQSPLRGDFEVTCRLSTAPRQDVHVGYAAFRLSLLPARGKFEVIRMGATPEQRVIDPNLADLGQSCDYRLEVRDGVCTTYLNGVRVHEEIGAVNCDPWLTLHSTGMCNGTVQNLRISGKPTIPASLDLLGQSDLIGWFTDYYETSQAGERNVWKKEGGVMVRARQNMVPGTHLQDVIRYHRPVLEDGEVEYEFYYEPGKVGVHPALDRLTFLLDPSGVRIHWLTDAQFDRTGALPDNVSDEPANRRGPQALPLKEREWNRLKLAVKGDDATLSLNGVEIYHRQLEATNQRILGLFHYADETEVRVRNVTYRGNWPLHLPPVNEQELADRP
jgi:tetratricopeptide (TPR) repeat protein